jgi:hypothetical protein
MLSPFFVHAYHALSTGLRQQIVILLGISSFEGSSYATASY